MFTDESFEKKAESPARMSQEDLLEFFNSLKPKEEVLIWYDSGIRRADDWTPMTVGRRSESKKYNLKKVSLTGKHGGKFILYNRQGKISLAMGGMATVLVAAKKNGSFGAETFGAEYSKCDECGSMEQGKLANRCDWCEMDMCWDCANAHFEDVTVRGVCPDSLNGIIQDNQHISYQRKKAETFGAESNRNEFFDAFEYLDDGFGISYEMLEEFFDNVAEENGYDSWKEIGETWFIGICDKIGYNKKRTLSYLFGPDGKETFFNAFDYLDDFPRMSYGALDEFFNNIADINGYDSWEDIGEKWVIGIGDLHNKKKAETFGAEGSAIQHGDMVESWAGTGRVDYIRGDKAKIRLQDGSRSKFLNISGLKKVKDAETFEAIGRMPSWMRGKRQGNENHLVWASDSKAVREAIKTAFPEQKFSVRIVNGEYIEVVAKSGTRPADIEQFREDVKKVAMKTLGEIYENSPEELREKKVYVLAYAQDFGAETFEARGIDTFAEPLEDIGISKPYARLGVIAAGITALAIGVTKLRK